MAIPRGPILVTKKEAWGKVRVDTGNRPSAFLEGHLP